MPDDLTPRTAAAGDLTADVAIVGGGLTGLWTAYYLARRNPSLGIVVLDKEITGFGASGRNGGWCSALFPTSTSGLERRHGRDAADRMRRAMIDTVDDRPGHRSERHRLRLSQGRDADIRAQRCPAHRPSIAAKVMAPLTGH